MKSWVLLSLLLAVGCVRGAPVDQGVEQGSCEDASAKGAADQALKKINQDRSEGYIFSLHRLSNVHLAKHGETGVVFYLTLDVVETNCSVVSRKDSKDCAVRPTDNTPVYGQCKATIYINRVNRVVRLYKYNCVVRPVPAARVNEVCPDCPVLTDGNSEQVKKAVTLSLDKFNKESTLSKRFAVINVERATAGMAMSMYYNVEYTIQETTCAQTADPAENCPLLDCEFAHKGFCKASLFTAPSGDPQVSVECEIYEPEAADREKKVHATSDHSHSHNHGHGHDHVHDHGHAHSHGHGHDHKHAHLHDHEHHHDHAHDHAHDAVAQHKPEGMVRTLPSMDQPMTLPAFPDVPAGGPVDGVTLPLKPDPQIPDMTEPTIQAFPTTASAQCTAPPKGEQLVEKLFDEDPMFKAAA